MLWIIRYIRTGEMESFQGTKAEAREHAEERAKEKKSGYVIT